MRRKEDADSASYKKMTRGQSKWRHKKESLRFGFAQRQWKKSRRYTKKMTAGAARNLSKKQSSFTAADCRADGGLSSCCRDFRDAGKPRTLRRPHRKAVIQNGGGTFDAASHGRSDKRNRGRKPQPASRYVRAGSKKPEGKHHLGRSDGFPKG